MEERPPRHCQQVISNEGAALKTRRKPSYREWPCGLEADTYCNDCALYLCSIHHGSRHDDHNTAHR